MSALLIGAVGIAVVSGAIALLKGAIDPDSLTALYGHAHDRAGRRGVDGIEHHGVDPARQDRLGLRLVLARVLVVHGYTVAFWVAAGTFGLGAIVVATIVRSIHVAGEHASTPAADPMTACRSESAPSLALVIAAG